MKINSNKIKKFIIIFVILAIGPTIYNIVSAYIVGGDFTTKARNFVGLLCLYSYYIGVFVARITNKVINKKV